MEWTSVDNEMPDLVDEGVDYRISDHVLATDGYVVKIAYYREIDDKEVGYLGYHDKNWYVVGNDEEPWEGVVAWMDLPLPPKIF